MKALCFLILGLSLNTNLNSQNWLWAKSIGQGGCADITSIADSKGFVYSAIKCGSSYTGSTSFCNYAPIFAKHDTLGNAIWVQTCSQGLATVHDMDVDGLDNLYVTGNIAGTCTLCGGTNTNVVITSGSSQQSSFIAKYNEQGDLQWIYLWDYPNIPTSGLEIETDRVGNSFVTGYGYSNYWGAVTYIKKFGPNGIQMWDQSYSQYDPFVISDLALDDLDNCYMTGYFHDSVEINQVKLYANPPICNICVTAFMAKLDGNGDVIWLKKTGGNDMYSRSINLDWQGNFYLSGNCMNTCSAGNYSLNATGFVAKFDTSGNNLWALNQQPRARYAITDMAGNYYTTGVFFGGSATFGTNSNSLTISSSRQSGELFLVKYDAQGNPAWVTIPTPGSTLGYNDPQQLICDNNDRLYLVGGFSGITIYGNSTVANTSTLSSLDAFITRVGALPPITTGFTDNGTSEWKVFPSLIDAFFTVSPKENVTGILQLTITDITNKLVLQGHIVGTQASVIDVRHLSPGVYIVHIEGKNTNIRKKLNKL